MKKKMMVATAVAITLVGFGAIAQARGPGHMMGRMGDVLEGVEATEAQKVKITGIVVGLAPEAMRLRAKLMPMRDAVRVELRKAKPDAAVVHKAINEMSGPLTAFAHKATDAMIQVHGVLTPTQRAKLAKRMGGAWPTYSGSWAFDMMFARGLDRMDATGSQRKLAARLKAEMEKEFAGLVAYRNKASAQVVKEMTSKTPNARALHGLVDRTGLVLTNFSHQGADALVELAGAMTPEQRSRAHQMMERHRARRHARGR